MVIEKKDGIKLGKKKAIAEFSRKEWERAKGGTE